MGESNYCNNCGKQGHLYHQCKYPITSFGVIAFRYEEGELQYLMICRKNTLGYIDFMRGKYSINNKSYIINMIKQMTNTEKHDLKTKEFNVLWKQIWGEPPTSTQYKNEEVISQEKFNILKLGVFIKNKFYTLDNLIDESNQYDNWEEPEWGFPKGRRNYQEKDYDCALREFSEETGYKTHVLHSIRNCFPFEENFTGSNYKSYKHIYYLMYMNYNDSLISVNYEAFEVSKLTWKSYDKCMNLIRDYNLEKKKILTNINNSLMLHHLYNSHIEL